MAGLDRSIALTAKVTPDDAREIRKAAEEQGVSVSEYLRSATLSYMALCRNRYALRLLVRGGLRVAADVGESILATLRRRGHDVPGPA